MNKTVSLISKPADRCRHVPPSAPVLVRGGESAPRSWLVVARVVRRRVVSGEFNGRLIMPFRRGDEGKGGARAMVQRRRRHPGRRRARRGSLTAEGPTDLYGVKADTVAQLVASRTVVYGLTCAFMLLSVETWWAVVARSLRVCSAAKIDHIHVAAS